MTDQRCIACGKPKPHNNDPRRANGGAAAIYVCEICAQRNGARHQRLKRAYSDMHIRELLKRMGF